MIDADITPNRLTELYQRYGRAIYSRCSRLLADPVAAEDATQETFLRVYRHLHAVPDADEALRWIYRVATNYCLNELRDQRHRPLPTDLMLDEPMDANPEGRLSDLEFARRLVWTAPERLRSTAWLHYVDGFGQAEVAQILGVSRRTVVYDLAEFNRRAQKLAATP
ncbi:MAG TPA: sigma-70 family RNA polymerase sigma factor [Polyangia bacterium]